MEKLNIIFNVDLVKENDKSFYQNRYGKKLNIEPKKPCDTLILNTVEFIGDEFSECDQFGLESLLEVMQYQSSDYQISSKNGTIIRPYKRFNSSVEMNDETCMYQYYIELFDEVKDTNIDDYLMNGENNFRIVGADNNSIYRFSKEDRAAIILAKKELERESFTSKENVLPTKNKQKNLSLEKND